MNQLRVVAALAAASACALASATPAGAVIQVQRGISGITLGMSQARVKEGLGASTKIKKGNNAFGPFTEFRYAGGIIVSFQGNAKVTNVAITGHTDRTASGIGVGSTEKAVKSSIKGVKCETSSGITVCHLGKLQAGKTVTSFHIRNGHVFRVSIGLVID